MAGRSVISQLTTVGEGALGKLAQSPATRTVVKGAFHLKDRGVGLVHGLESVDARLAAIERRLAAIEKAAKPPRAGSRARRGSEAAGGKPAA